MRVYGGLSPLCVRFTADFGKNTPPAYKNRSAQRIFRILPRRLHPKKQRGSTAPPLCFLISPCGVRRPADSPPSPTQLHPSAPSRRSGLQFVSSHSRYPYRRGQPRQCYCSAGGDAHPFDDVVCAAVVSIQQITDINRIAQSRTEIGHDIDRSVAVDIEHKNIRV